MQILPIIAPLFALILAGYVCRKRGYLGPSAAAELNKFVVYLALPALLFDVLARTPLSTLNQPRFLLAYGLSSAAMFGGVVLLRKLQARPIADASIDAMGASYANTGFMGLPLCALALGSQSQAPAIIATILTVCVVFAVGIFCVELGLQQERGVAKVLGRIALKLFSNPLILAPLAGVAFSYCGFSVPASAGQFLKVLGGAATPCALISIGLFLGAEQPARQQAPATGTKRTAFLLVALKLVGQPALTWLLVTQWLPLPHIWANTAILMSALPTGTGPYMLAEFYQREAAITSRVILFSTVASVLTVSVLLSWMRV